MRKQKTINRPPVQEILSYAVKTLTADWSEEEQQKFSKHCFDTVCSEKYSIYGKNPYMDIKIMKLKRNGNVIY